MEFTKHTKVGALQPGDDPSRLMMSSLKSMGVQRLNHEIMGRWAIELIPLVNLQKAMEAMAHL